MRVTRTAIRAVDCVFKHARFLKAPGTSGAFPWSLSLVVAGQDVRCRPRSVRAEWRPLGWRALRFLERRSTKRYLSKKRPSRPFSGPPHAIQVSSRSIVSGPASSRTRRYSAPQFGHLNGVGRCSVIAAMCDARPLSARGRVKANLSSAIRLLSNMNEFCIPYSVRFPDAKRTTA